MSTNLGVCLPVPLRLRVYSLPLPSSLSLYICISLLLDSPLPLLLFLCPPLLLSHPHFRFLLFSPSLSSSLPLSPIVLLLCLSLVSPEQFILIGANTSAPTGIECAINLVPSSYHGRPRTDDVVISIISNWQSLSPSQSDNEERVGWVNVVIFSRDVHFHYTASEWEKV